jgi:aminotransferase
VVAIEGDDALIASGVEQPSIGAVAGLGPRTVTIGGFAAVGLEAWRVGYLAAQREMMGDIRRLKQELSICSPAVSQYAALDAIPHLAGYAAALREQLDVRRTAVARALEHADFEHVVPQAGIFAFVKPPSGMPVRTAIASAAEAGVLVADGGCVGADGWLRLTLDHDRQILDEAVRELANAIDHCPDRRR